MILFKFVSRAPSGELRNRLDGVYTVDILDVKTLYT